jgi:hypothetical protein
LLEFVETMVIVHEWEDGEVVRTIERERLEEMSLIT